MASFNRVILVGNLTRDPQDRSLPSGMLIVELGLAVNDRRKAQNGEWIEETTFVDITFFGRQAEVARDYLKKGASVLVEGRLRLDRWETKEGEKRSKLLVIGDRMVMLGGRGEGGGGGGGGGGSYRSQGGGRRAPASSQYDDGGYDSGADYGGPTSGGGGGGGAQDDDIPF